MFKPKGRHVRQSQVEKFTRYSIRKVSFGAASVAVATGLFFLGGGSVQAAEQVTNSEPTEVQNPQNVNEKSSEPSREVTGQASATAKEPDGQNNTSVKESSPVNETSAVETPEVVAEKVAINTASLEDLVAKVEGRLSQLTEGKKTKSVIDDAKNLVNKAKELLNDDTKTQAKVNALAKQLSSSLFILNSIKSEATKVNKNQNPRNGQAIPSNGESGFRDTGTVADGTENPVVVNTNDITQKASELEVEIAKVESLISAENAKGEGQTDKELVGILTQVKESAQAVKNKGNNIPTTEKEKHALLQELKEKVDLLKLYQAKKLDWGAPANNHLANYGNNPSDAVISNLNDTFGTPDFSNATSHTKRVEDQASGIRGAINLGSATYHWKQKEITVDEAKAGALGGWKIVDKEGANTVNIVKPEAPTDIEYKEGQSATTYAPKPAKVYDNNGHVTATGGQGRPNAGGGVLNYMISTDRLGNGSIGKVNKDYYVELKKQGTTIYKDFDVNPNSHLYANLVFSSAYGKLGLSSTGEKIKMKIVDAYTGQPLSELTRKDGKASDTEFIGQPGSDSDGFAALWRVVKVPEGTTKVRVFVEAGDQPTTSDYLNGHKVEDGYIVAGLGLTPGPALTLTTTVVSGKDKEAYGYTEDSIYKNAQKGTFNVTLSNHGGVGVVYQTQYEVTLKVPKGVKLGTLQGTDLNEVNGKNLFAPSYTYGFKYNKDTRELTFKIDLPKRNINPTSGSSNTVSIPFEVTPDFVGEATFEVVGKNGFGGKDKLGNVILPYGIAGADRYNIPVNVNANSLETSDNPDYKYNRSIYIDSMTGNSTITVPVGTTFEKAKEAATVSAEELLNSEAYREKLATLKATAALNLSETSSIAMVQGYSTAAVKENSGTLKVPVIHTIGSKNFNNQIDINVNVVASTKQQKVVFEGDTIQNDDIKGKITPATIPGYTATINNVQNMPTTTGKAGQIINVETTVSYTKGNVVLPETVTVPVLVLPKATGNVEVIKGSTVDKVKEVAKAKAEEVANSADFKAKLPEGSKDVEVGAITEEVLAAITTEAGTNKGTVKVPVTYTVDGVKYTKDAEITVNVVGSNADPVYVVEGDKPEVDKVKDAVKPGEGGTVQDPTEVDLPNTKDKVGATDVTVPTKVKYANGEETVNVPVTVLPKVTPEGVKVLKDSTGLEEVVKAKVTEAATATTKLPDGVTVRVKEVKAGTVPATTATGVQTPATAVVEYVKDGNVVVSKEVEVPVTVVGSTPKSLVVFEGDTVEAKTVQDAVTPGTDGTKGEPAIPEDLTKTPGKKEVTVPVTYDGITEPEQVKVPVTVLPKPEADEILVAKNSDKDKAKEKVLAKAKKAIEDATFTGKLPQGATVTVDETATVTVPDLTEDTEVDVTVKYTVPGQDTPLTTTVKVPVTVVEGVPQIVPVDENNKQPDPEKSIDKTDYPDDATFEYKEEVDTSTLGDKKVTVVVKQGDKVLVEVPSTVRVVGSTPQFVVADPTKKQPEAKDSVTPGDYPEGTTFEYKTPVDTTTAGEKDVTVVAKLNGQPIAEVPAKVVVVDPKTQYVVADPSKPQPDASKSIDPEQYPDGTTFEYKTPVDTTTPGEKDVVVVAKDGEDKLVEVPTKVKVVQGNPQIVPVDEGKKQPSPEDSIDPNDYPEDATFEYKEEVDTSTPGDKKVTVVVKQGDKVLVEVPSTVRVVGSTPQFVVADPTKKQPEAKDSVTPGDYPEGTTFEYKTPVDTTTAGEKDVTVVAKLNGQPIAEVPAKVVVVEPKTQYVVADPSKPQPDASKSIDPEQYPDGTTFEYKTPVDTTTPGEKDVVVVAKDGEDKLVEVPTKVKVVQGNPQIVPVDEGKKQPSPEDSIDPNDYPEDATFEYKEEVDTSTPGDKKVTVVVKQGDKVLVEVPSTVRVVGSTPQFVVADPAKKQPEAKDSVTPGEYPDGTTFEYKTPVDTTTAGEKDVTVVAKLNGQPIAEVPAKVVVVEPKTQYVVADPSKPQPDASKSIDPEQYPDGTTFEYKTPVDTTTPGEKDVVVVAKNGEDKLVEVPTKVKVVQGNPQIVPVDEGKKQPSPEDSIDPNDYPDDATFEYKEEVDTSTPGDKKVTVVVKQGDKVLVEVPSTVRVVGSTPQFVVADPAKKQPEAKDSVTPGEYPDGTTFEYKTPVDTTTAGEKDVTVVAKLNGQPIAEVPAKVVVVDPKTQYVVADPSKPQPDASKSIDPEQYPEGTTFEYKTPVDTTTPGEKDVVVVAKDGEDKLVEVPTKVKVVQGNPQIVPVDEGKKQPDPEDSIDSNDYPDDATFEYKEEVDTSTPGDKKVTVVVKQGDKVLVEVPSTVRVVESYPKYVPVDPAKKQPDPKENINPNDFPTGTTFEYKDNTPVDTTTPGEKPVTVVAKLNGQPITEIPATIVVVESKTQYVPVNAENDKKPKPQDSITPDDYPAGSTFEYKTPEGKTEAYDGSTPGDKDVTVVVKDSDGDPIVEVPAKIKVVQGKEQLTPVNAEDKDKPKAEDSVTPSDYPEGSTFEYKVPEGQTTPYDGTTPGDKPVTVVVKDKDGKVLVEVPATIKVVETKPTPIETPVTNTPLTEDDYTKGMKIPEGGKVTKVENIPDLTTPGENPPVKVTITLPNGKSYTVDVPVTVTPVKEIETPVTTTPLTPEDYTKGIKIPEGGKVTNVANIPDLTTPGKKDPVKVTIELPNGKVVTVEIPVTVTSIEDIVKKEGDPITNEDVEKHIPKGVKVISIGDKPTTDIPGERPSIPVVIELPNGIRVTVNIPVIVTPKVTPVVVSVGTPVTPEDVQKHIELPNGWKVTKVGEIPTTTTPGTKPVVPVEIELPDGRKITVDVPVIVTPTVRQIVVPQGTPITPDDVKGHIDLPKEPGWEIVEVGEIPTTIPAGVKPSVKVKIKVPTGEIVEVEVPIIVTPKVTPIVVEVGTPITKEDVIKKVGLPEGWEIVEVGEIPTTETPGTKPVVKVKVKLPDGRIITVEVPVTVTPKSQNGDSTVQIVTEYLDENGNRITSDKEGKHNPIELEGYEFSHSTTDAKGNTLHHYKKVTNPINQEQPSSNDKKELPNTGTEDKAGLASLGLLGMLGAFGLVARKKKED
ncbi:Rib/alpha-like domain-containing protein [Streptococcus mitis]|uniref:Rib/alpha-like domain-containing protein n=1 Tax=Streptococcus mitis TaxID=28037 RepID=UPI0039C09D30